MKDLKTFVNENFDESDALESLIDEACDEFISELNIDGEEDKELQESLRKKAGALKSKARAAIKKGGSNLKSKANNAKSKAKSFVKSLWTDTDHY